MKEVKKIIENSKLLIKFLIKILTVQFNWNESYNWKKASIKKNNFLLIGHPIYGDDKYTFEKNLKTKNKELMLHSYKIKFIINNKKYTFKALLPSYFKKLIKTKRLKFLN